MSKNIHKEPFDDGTLLKLGIFKAYLKEWLPVFLAKGDPIWRTINVFDFFAGPGKDVDGNVGSPLIIMEELLSSNFNGMPFDTLVKEKGFKVNLFFNEYLKGKFEELKGNLLEYLEKPSISTHLSNEDFKVVFDRYRRMIAGKDSANLLFLDQNGIKQIDPEVFNFVVSHKQTDFIFYISSSFINRFSEEDSFKKYLQISKSEFDKRPYHHCHKVVLEYYRSLIPAGISYFLAPFSIKKGTNIYGLIFGTGHLLGIEKFLRICWEIDPERGEANFDIDGDKINPSAPSLFAEFDIPKKIQVFEDQLREFVENGKIGRYHEALRFGLNSGFLPRHVNDAIKLMVKQGVLKGPPKFVSNNVHRLVDSEEFQLKKNR